MEHYVDLVLQAVANNFIGYVVTGLCAFALTKWQEAKKREEVYLELAKLGREIEVMMARNTIRHLCKNAIESGWIDIKEKDDILAMHECYEKIIKKLNIENGTTEDCIERMRKLPNVCPAKVKK